MSERMDLLVARPYEKDGEERTFFTKIGTAWPMKERDGYSLTFDALPLPSMNREGKLETRILMMPPKQDGDAPPARQQSGSAGGYGAAKDNSTRRPAAQSPAFDSGGMDDDIPF
jgi:hypothetical protein